MRDLRFVYQPELIPENKKELVKMFHNKCEIFNQQYEAICLDINSYDNYINNNKYNHWGELKPELLEITNFLCPICESEIDEHADIDHFRPREIYWWLAYDTKNYVILCPLCNRNFKRAKFPLFENKVNITFETKHLVNKELALLFNPFFDNPFDLFWLEFTNESGVNVLNIIPNIYLDKNSYRYAKALETIMIYNLNNTSKKSGSRQNKRIKFYDNLIYLAILYKKYAENKENKLLKMKFAQQLKINKSISIGLFQLLKKQQYTLNIIELNN